MKNSVRIFSLFLTLALLAAVLSGCSLFCSRVFFSGIESDLIDFLTADFITDMQLP